MLLPTSWCSEIEGQDMRHYRWLQSPGISASMRLADNVRRRGATACPATSLAKRVHISIGRSGAAEEQVYERFDWRRLLSGCEDR